jgi:PTH1 family peptidyl-tRNA hydrolase
MKLYCFPLGNPGEQYAKTRHNAARVATGGMNWKALEDKDIEYYRPDTFMNMSGEFVKKKLKNVNLEKAKIVILYDDIDIPLGEVKLSYDRSSGGHNGVQSVIDAMGTKEFFRIRIGIGAKTVPEMSLQDYVMSALTPDEIFILKKLDEKIEKMLEQVKCDSRK